MVIREKFAVARKRLRDRDRSLDGQDRLESGRMITTAVVTTATRDGAKRAEIKFRHEILLLSCNDRSSIDGDYETAIEALTERIGLHGAGAQLPPP
jgi:hypothetical protein